MIVFFFGILYHAFGFALVFSSLSSGSGSGLYERCVYRLIRMILICSGHSSIFAIASR